MMDVDVSWIERRQFERFQVKSNVYALLGPQTSAIGKIIDVSYGGLAFSTTDSGDLIRRLAELDIFVQGKGFFLYQAPIRTVENGMNTDMRLGEVPLIRCCIQFDELLPVDRKRLRSFIQRYTYN